MAPGCAASAFGLGLTSSGLASVFFGFHLRERADHVQRAFWVVLEFIVQDALRTVQRVGQTNQLAWQARELLSGEERLRQEALNPARTRGDDIADRRTTWQRWACLFGLVA
jgi:hypothetical protein